MAPGVTGAMGAGAARRGARAGMTDVNSAEWQLECGSLASIGRDIVVVGMQPRGGSSILNRKPVTPLRPTLRLPAQTVR